MREKESLKRLVTDVHSPPNYRVNGILPNFDKFYKTWDVKEKDEMYDIFFLLPDHLVDVIYQMKKFMEEDEARDWHLKCPRYIPDPPKWIPVNINDNWKIGNIEFKKKQIVLLTCLVFCYIYYLVVV